MQGSFLIAGSRRCRIRLAGSLHRRRDPAFVVDLCSRPSSRSLCAAVLRQALPSLPCIAAKSRVGRLCRRVRGEHLGGVRGAGSFPPGLPPISHGCCGLLGAATRVPAADRGSRRSRQQFWPALLLLHHSQPIMPIGPSNADPPSFSARHSMPDTALDRRLELAECFQMRRHSLLPGRELLGQSARLLLHH